MGPGDCTFGIMSGAETMTTLCENCITDGCNQTINPDIDCENHGSGNATHPGIDFAQGSCMIWNDATACNNTEYALIAECFAPNNTCSDSWYSALGQGCNSCSYGNALRLNTGDLTADNYDSIYGPCHTPAIADDKTSGVALATPVLAALIALVAMV